jgi:hypothetical protein
MTFLIALAVASAVPLVTLAYVPQQALAAAGQGYLGNTDQRCPAFAVAMGLCNEREYLPISFEATAGQVGEFKAVVVEDCEDGLPARMVEVGLQKSYNLRPDGTERASFNFKPGRHQLPVNEAEGIVGSREAHGLLRTQEKDPEDPSGAAYCYATVEWRAFPGAHAGGALLPLPEHGVSAEPGASGNPPSQISASEEQECVNIAVSGLVKDPGNGLTMYHAGIRPDTPGLDRNTFQDVRGSYRFQTMPDGSAPGQPDCSGIHRAAASRLEMQSEKHPAKFRLLIKQPAFPVEPSRSGMVGVGVDWGATGSEGIFDRCPDGKHWLKVRDKETLLARDVRTHKLLGTRIYTWPVRISGSCRAAARSSRLVNGFGVRK